MNIAVRELKDHLSEYLHRASVGEEVVVTSHGKPIARLAPLLLNQHADTAIDQLEAQSWIIPARKKTPFPVSTSVVKTSTGEMLMSDIALGLRE